MEASATAAVIVTRNRRDMLERAISSVAAQRPAPPSTLIVVDNASTDDTRQWLIAASQSALSEVFDQVQVVGLDQNVGGCGGFNQGFKAAGETLQGIQAVWLMDDDAEADPEALHSMLVAINVDASIAAVGATTIDSRDRTTPLESTIFFDESQARFADLSPAQQPVPVGGPDGELGYEVDAVSACCQLARWSAFEKFQGWDERFFLYCDDADWCTRARLGGHKLVSVSDAKVFHAPWHTKLTPEREYYFNRNMLMLIANNFAGSVRTSLTRKTLKRGIRSVLHRLRKGKWRSAAIATLAMLDGVKGTGGQFVPSRAGDGSRVRRAVLLASLAVVVAFVLVPLGAAGPRPMRVTRP